MNIKDRKSHLFFLIAILFARTGCAGDISTAWDFSPVGECIKNYKAPKPTEEYPVVVQAVKNSGAHKNRYLWIWDPTPEKNPTRQLVRINQKNVGCTILFIPFSEFHDFKLAPGGELPEKVISTSSTVNGERGAYAIEQEYLLNKKTGFYQKMPICYKVKVDRGGRQKINCQSAVGE